MTQEHVKEFVNSRNWESPGVIKDLLLNIVEETGEAWNIVKWVGPEEQEKLIQENKDSFKDFVGDQLFLLYRIANIAGVNAEEAVKETLDEYEKRFPVKETKGKHTNILAGGTDHKYN